MNNGLRPFDRTTLPNFNALSNLPPNWQVWQYEGQVIFDKPIRPTFPTSVETLERRLTISNGTLGEEQMLVLPHFNAHSADFIEGDKDILLCHTQADIADPENHFTPDFFALNGGWSFVLNLDTQTGWSAGRGVGRNRHYAWEYTSGQARFLKRPTASSQKDETSRGSSGNSNGGSDETDYSDSKEHKEHSEAKKVMVAMVVKAAHVLQNLIRYLPHANQGARNVFAEGYVDIRPLYKRLMTTLIQQDAAQIHGKERNFRAKPGNLLQAGDSLLR